LTQIKAPRGVALQGYQVRRRGAPDPFLEPRREARLARCGTSRSRQRGRRGNM